MMPAGYAALEGQLALWLIAAIRPGAAFFAAPLFGGDAVPVQVRFIIALGIGLPATGALHAAMPPQGMLSLPGVALVAGEVLAGLALGLAVRIGYSAALVAGEVIGNAMGLGFAAMVDPASGQQSNAVSTWLSILATFLFLAGDGHLALAATVAESHAAMPPGQGGPAADAMESLARFGGVLFSAGLAIALPVGFAVLLVQIIMASLARSAPQLNLFAVGLPAALIGGILLLAIATPTMADAIILAIGLGLEQAAALATGG